VPRIPPHAAGSRTSSRNSHHTSDPGVASRRTDGRYHALLEALPETRHAPPPLPAPGRTPLHRHLLPACDGADGVRTGRARRRVRHPRSIGSDPLVRRTGDRLERGPPPRQRQDGRDGLRRRRPRADPAQRGLDLGGAAGRPDPARRPPAPRQGAEPHLRGQVRRGAAAHAGRVHVRTLGPVIPDHGRPDPQVRSARHRQGLPPAARPRHRDRQRELRTGRHHLQARGLRQRPRARTGHPADGQRTRGRVLPSRHDTRRKRRHRDHRRQRHRDDRARLPRRRTPRDRIPDASAHQERGRRERSDRQPDPRQQRRRRDDHPRLRDRLPRREPDGHVHGARARRVDPLLRAAPRRPHRRAPQALPARLHRSRRRTGRHAHRRRGSRP
jgi:hypothetical protein